MSFILSFGRYDGVYIFRGYSWRLCLGWVAFTFVPRDIDNVVEAGLRALEDEQK